MMPRVSARGSTEDIDLWFEGVTDPRPKDLAAIPAIEVAIALLARREPLEE